MIVFLMLLYLKAFGKLLIVFFFFKHKYNKGLELIMSYFEKVEMEVITL